MDFVVNINNIIESLYNDHYFKAFKTTKKMIGNTITEYDGVKLNKNKMINDLILLRDKHQFTIDDKMMFGDIYKSLKHYVNDTVMTVGIFLNGLINLLKLEKHYINKDNDTITRTPNADDILLNIRKTNLTIYTNIGYLYGFISWLVAHEVIYIKYDCGEECSIDLKRNEKKCVNTLFNTMDGTLSGTGSKTIIFKGQLFSGIEYEINYELLLRLIKKTISRPKTIDYNDIIQQLTKLVSMINIFIMSFRPLLFTKLYSIPRNILHNDAYYLTNAIIDYREEYIDEMKRHLSKYESINEINIYKYLTNAMYNNHLPHVLSYITDIECNANMTKLNDVVLSCGKLKECYNEKLPFEYDKYKLLILEHAGKNSVSLTEFVKQSWREEITQHDIAAIILQIAYTLYVMNYVLGIIHNDLHCGNIFIEKYWRIRSSHYYVGFGRILNDIYMNYHIFDDCKDDPEWEIRNGCKGLINIQSQYEVKIIDFDSAHLMYDQYDRQTLELIKNIYCKSNTPYNKVYEHTSEQIMSDMSDMHNKFFIYKNTPETYSDQLYEKNRQFGIDNIFRPNTKVSDGLTFGDIVTLCGTLKTLPRYVHKYDFTTVLFRIMNLINYDLIKTLSRDQVEVIKHKWFGFIKYILNSDHPSGNPLDYNIFYTRLCSLNSGFKNYFKRSEINNVCEKSKTPISVLFDVFKNNTYISKFFASREHPTKRGIDHTKLYAYHINQFSERTKIIEHSTLFTPPDVDKDIALRALREILPDDIDVLSRVAPQLLNDENKLMIIQDLYDKVESLNGPLVQF